MKRRAPRNRTLICKETEVDRLSAEVLQVERPVSEKDITGKVIRGDMFEVAGHLPKGFVDLLILDPPYNLLKNYNDLTFEEKGRDDYQKWFQNALEVLLPTLHPTATIYVCSDWKTSVLIAPILEARFHLSRLEMPNCWRIGMGADSNCELKQHQID